MKRFIPEMAAESRVKASITKIRKEVAKKLENFPKSQQ